MSKNKRNIYVVVDPDCAECYSNLSKLIRNNRNFTYYTVYRALLKANRIERDGVMIYKTVLK